MEDARQTRRASGATARCRGTHVEAFRRDAVSNRSEGLARRVQQDRSADHACIQWAAIAQGDDRRDHVPQNALDAETTAVPMGREPAPAISGGGALIGTE